MKLRISISLSAALVGGFVNVASGQGAGMAEVVLPPNGQGMWTGDGVGVQVSRVGQGTAPLAGLRVRESGTSVGTLLEWDPTRFGGPTDDHPDYSSEALFAHWTPQLFGLTSGWEPGTELFNPELGGWSSGGDVVPSVRTDGSLNMTGQSNLAWYNLSFTVDSEASGVEDSILAAASAASGGASNHVFSYTAEASTGIRAAYVDTIRVEVLPGQLPIAGGGQPATEISALDWGMGLISETGSGMLTDLQPIRDRLYFTLSRRWFNAYFPAGAALPVVGGQDLSLSNVYVMTWDNGTWSPPAVAFDAQALFNTAPADVAIDALSVQAVTGNPFTPAAVGSEPRVIFSLDPQSEIASGVTPGQILVSQRGSWATGTVDVFAADLAVDGGTSMVTKLGLLDGSEVGTVPDNVTGLCGRDPKEGAGLDPYKGYPIMVATPTGATSVELSMLRDNGTLGDAADTADVDLVRIVASGIDEAGYDVALVEFELSLYSVGAGGALTLEDSRLATAWGEASDQTIELIEPITLKPAVGVGYQLHVEATLYRVRLTPTFFLDPVVDSALPVAMILY